MTKTDKSLYKIHVKPSSFIKQAKINRNLQHQLVPPFNEVYFAFVNEPALDNPLIRVDQVGS